jgi:hypothetical protein
LLSVLLSVPAVPDAARTDEFDTLRAELARASEACEHYHQLYLAALEKMRKLALGLLGQKAERLPEPEAQLTLALLAQLLGRPTAGEPTPAPPGTQTIPEHTRNKPTGRKPLPAHIPRVDVEVLPDEVTRAGLDAFEKIGERLT